MYCAYTNTYFSVCSDCGEVIAADNCADANFPSICNLDGFHFTTCGFTPDGPGGLFNFCGPSTAVHNNAWIGFTPGRSGRLHLNIEIVYCESANSNCNGLQAAVARAQCRNPGNEFFGFEYETLDCVNCVDQSFDLITTDAIEGVPHYIMIDGCCGDVCEIIIHVIDGFPDRAYDINSETSLLCPSIATGDCFSPQSFASVTAVPIDGTLDGTNYLFDWYDQNGNLFYSDSGSPNGEGGLTSTVTGINPDTDKPYFCEDGITSVTIDFFSKKTCCREEITFELNEAIPEPAETSFADPQTTSLNCLNNQLIVRGNPVNPDVDILFESWQKVESEGFPLNFKSIPINDYNSNTSELTVFSADPNNANRQDPHTGKGVYLYSFIDRNSVCVSEALICIPSNTIQPNVIINSPPPIDCGSNTIVKIDASGSEIFSAILDCDDEEIKEGRFPREEIVPTDNFIVQWTSLDDHPISNADQLIASVTLPGLYECTIINNDNMCSATNSTLVTSSGSVPLIDLPQVVDIGCSLSIDLDATISSGNTGNYTYTWSDGNGVISADAQVTLETPGYYTLTVSDNVSQCLRTETIEVIATDDGGPRIEPMTATDITCIASTSFIDPIITGDSDYSFNWLQDGNQFATSEDITVTEAGVYTIIVTDDITGCTSDQSIRVYLHQEIPVIIPFDDTVLNCENDGVTKVYATFDGIDEVYIGGMVYEWYDANGTLVGDYNFLEVTESGNYTVKVVNNFNGCTAEETLDVTVDDDLPFVEPLVAEPLNCINQVITLKGKGNTGTAASRYEWIHNGTVISTTEEVEIIEGGNYEFKVINIQNGCAKSENILVDEDYDEPYAEAGILQELTCNNPAIALDGSNSSGNGILNFEWSGLNGISVGPTMVANEAGTYTLTIIDQSNGCTAMSTVEVIENIDPPQALNAEGENLTCLDQVVELNVSSVNTNVSYEWISPSDVSMTGDQINANEPGTYTVIATNLDNGCTSETSFDLEEDLSAPEGLSATNGLIDCVNSETTISASSNSDDVSYEWISPGNISTQGEILSATSAGTYTVVATNLATGCTSMTTAIVEADADIPSLDLNYLDGTTAQLNCNTSSTILEGRSNAGINIQWLDPNNNVLTENPITVFEPGQYILTATNPQNLCESEIVVNILADFDEPEIEASSSANNITCEVSTIELSAFEISGNIINYEWIDETGKLVSTNSTGTIDQQGTYTVIASGNNGCTSETTINIGLDDQEPIISTSPDFMLTCNENTYELNCISDLTNDVTYNWNGPNGFTSNEANPTIDQKGIYVCEVVNLLNSCQSTAEVIITEDNEVVNASISGVEQLNCLVPSLELLGNADQDDVSYNWIIPGQNQSTQQNIEVEVAGEYILLVTDLSSGCTATETVIIEASFDAPEISVLGGEIDCKEASINLEANSNNNNLTYSWTGPDGFTSAIQNPEVTESGEYTLTVIADNGCSSTAVATVIQDENTPNAEIASDFGNTINCNNAQLMLSGISSIDDVQYTWTHQETGNINTGAELNISEAGTYTLLVVDPTNGCSEINSIVISTDFTEPDLIANGNVINCYQNEVSLLASSSNQIASIEWAGPNYLSNELEAKNIVEPGMYTATITSAENGCTSTTIVEVVEDLEEPIVVANTETITCILTDVPLSGIGSSEGAEFTYAWEQDGIVVSNDLNFSTDNIGTYTLNITNTNNGCSASSVITVEQNVEAPIADAGEAATLTCGEDFETLNADASFAQGDLSYSWINEQGAEISNISTFNTSETGTFTLVVTDLINGCTSFDEVIINQDVNAPTINFAPVEKITCETSSINLDASASYGQGSILLEWTDANSNIVGNETVIEVTEAGVYQLMIMDMTNDCITTASVEVEEDTSVPIFNIDEPQMINCINTSTAIILNDLEATDPNFAWTGPNNFSSSNQDLEGVETAGVYILTVIDHANGCESEYSVEILADLELPMAEADVEERFSCAVTEIIINGSASSPGLEYQWYGPSIVSGENSLNPIVDQEGLYTLLVVNPESGCESSTAIMVNRNETIIEGVEIDAADENCFGPNTGSIEFQQVINGTAPFVYSIDGGGVFTQELIYKNLSSGDYEIMIEDAIGCQFSTSIEIGPAIDLFLDYTSTADDNTIFAGQAVQLIPENNFEIDAIEWSDPAIQGLFPFVSPESTTTYTMTAYDENGCLVEDEITIYVESSRSIYIPNGFSPNGDGINDNFVIFANVDLVQQVQIFQIFDRWGSEVFTLENFVPNDESFGWDGTFKNEALEPGVYIYNAVILLINGETSMLRGEVTIIR